MARQIVTTCDANVTVKVKECGESHDDLRTFTIRVDGDSWEVDLGGTHAEALLEIARRGRKLDPGIRRPSSTENLNRRIRGIPESDSDE